MSEKMGYAILAIGTIVCVLAGMNVGETIGITLIAGGAIIVFGAAQ